ncbi:hypothetical protein [Desulfosporosinus metallidurans]|uniref:Uncharacterized protein n=1 Tax=Desulfosporosinus metallidurans TaxID=1888891 RepID=A0A1Q8QY67_9FIRM|nr:hypothetical protein [Desulfosporosinus metallidurans]OLN32283.1 hypothetical protein DSOL_1889 [Desulfosporosinus metallidurans]
MYGYGVGATGYGAGCCRPVAPVAPVGVGCGVGVGIIAIAILILIALGVIF